MQSQNQKVIILGGGCFWKIELLYQRLEGVIATRAGYIDGLISHPCYKLICTGATGHAEVVEVTYDPDVITLTTILSEFFMIHDPTQKDRQGLDIGTQYRSCIYYRDAEDEGAINKHIESIRADYEIPIQTTVKVAPQFWPAEELHQRYLEKAGQSAAKGCDDIIMCYN